MGISYGTERAFLRRKKNGILEGKVWGKRKTRIVIEANHRGCVGSKNLRRLRKRCGDETTIFFGWEGGRISSKKGLGGDRTHEGNEDLIGTHQKSWFRGGRFGGGRGIA